MSRVLFPLLLAVALLGPARPAAALTFEQAVVHPGAGARYLIYLHGDIVETGGKHAVSPRYGAYDYAGIVKAFEDRGLTVVEEERGRVDPDRYAARVAQEVRRLLAKGVPADHITVAGFSKGGLIALLVASSLNEPDLRYVVLAGCGRGLRPTAYQRFLDRHRGKRLRGRILSIHVTGDLEAGSCVEAERQHAGEGLTFRELPVRSRRGHGLFYLPLPEWVIPVAAFAVGGE